MFRILNFRSIFELQINFIQRVQKSAPAEPFAADPLRTDARKETAGTDAILGGTAMTAATNRPLAHEKKCKAKKFNLVPETLVELESMGMDERYAGTVRCFGHTYLFTRKEYLVNTR